MGPESGGGNLSGDRDFCHVSTKVVIEIMVKAYWERELRERTLRKSCQAERLYLKI